MFEEFEDETIVPPPDRINALIADVALGNQIVSEFSTKGSAINLVFDRARREAERGLAALVECNLETAGGLANAKTAQSHVLRYRDLIRWLDGAIKQADQSEALIADTGLEE
jgi:hypothetical protein